MLALGMGADSYATRQILKRDSLRAAPQARLGAALLLRGGEDMFEQSSIASPGRDAGPGVVGEFVLAAHLVPPERSEDEWKTMLRSLGLDERVWEIVAGIFESGEVRFEVVTGDRAQIEADLFGFPQRTFGRGKSRRRWRETLHRVNGGLLLTRAGWGYAMPIVQQALDHLDIAYDSSRSGLICRRGTFAVEAVYTGDGAIEYPMFDCDHSNSSSYGYCRRSWSGRDLSFLRRLPVRRRLVRVEGWAFCKSCQVPIRPRDARSVARSPIAA